MVIRKIEEIPFCAGEYRVYYLVKNDSTIVDKNGEVKEHIKAGSVLHNTIYIDESDIANWDKKSKELKEQWEYWGFPDFPENPDNLRCSSCHYCIWTSHFKYCTQLNRELNNWFRINARLKDCPF